MGSRRSFQNVIFFPEMGENCAVCLLLQPLPHSTIMPLIGQRHCVCKKAHLSSGTQGNWFAERFHSPGRAPQSVRFLQPKCPGSEKMKMKGVRPASSKFLLLTLPLTHSSACRVLSPSSGLSARDWLSGFVIWRRTAMRSGASGSLRSSRWQLSVFFLTRVRGFYQPCQRCGHLPEAPPVLANVWRLQLFVTSASSQRQTIESHANISCVWPPHRYFLLLIKGY